MIDEMGHPEDPDRNDCFQSRKMFSIQENMPRQITSNRMQIKGPKNDQSGFLMTLPFIPHDILRHFFPEFLGGTAIFFLFLLSTWVYCDHFGVFILFFFLLDFQNFHILVRKWKTRFPYQSTIAMIKYGFINCLNKISEFWWNLFGPHYMPGLKMRENEGVEGTAFNPNY